MKRNKTTASEKQIVSMIKQEAEAKGHMLERNNSGVMINPAGRPVRFGVGNDSSVKNKHWKSPDLVGIKKVLITQDMVGKYIGQALARECKLKGWVYKGTPHEKAQKACIDKINAMGGDACFVTDIGTI